MHFGPAILSDDGEISRPVLAETVFDNPAELSELNRLVHPAVREALAEWATARRAEAAHAAALVPLLFESGMDTLDWDAVLCVTSSETEVLARLTARGLSHEEAMKRMQSQMSLPMKEARADYVVPNHGTLEDLERITRKTVASIIG
jgi:dephospho-CoA kinase